MSTHDQLDIIKALISTARPEILRSYRADSCIASTRIGIDALAYFGIESRPLPVECLLWNHGGVRAVRENRPIDTSPLSTEWGVALGTPDDTDPGPQVGHLVILLDRSVSEVPDCVSFVDLSLDQAARPHKGIHAVPGLYSCPAEWLTMDPPAWAEFPQEWGLVSYRPSGNQSYRTSPNWRRTRYEREVTGKVIRAMRAERTNPSNPELTDQQQG